MFTLDFAQHYDVTISLAIFDMQSMVFKVTYCIYKAFKCFKTLT